MRRDITVTISGGERFERDALTSEFVALLNSLHVLVGFNRVLIVVDSDEHDDRIQHLSRNVVVYFKESEHEQHEKGNVRKRSVGTGRRRSRRTRA